MSLIHSYVVLFVDWVNSWSPLKTSSTWIYIYLSVIVISIFLRRTFFSKERHEARRRRRILGQDERKIRRELSKSRRRQRASELIKRID